MTGKKKSFREIARLCNVSASTVSRLANGITGASGEKADLILSYLQNEGYEVKTPAQDRSEKTVSLIVSDLTIEIFNRITTALSRLLAEQNYTLAIYISRGNTQELIDSCIRRRDAALILMGLSQETFQIESPIPVVQVMGYTDIRYRNEIYGVFSDDYVGGQLVARKLLSHGCTHPLVLNIRYSLFTVIKRIEGFLDEYKKAGIAIPETDIYPADPGKSSYSDALDTVSYLWTKGVDYDCVFAASDWRAYGAISALRNMGISDVTVVGYDGSQISRYGTYPFPSVQQNPDLIAAAAVRLLFDLLNGRTPEQKSVVIPVQMSHTGN